MLPQAVKNSKLACTKKDYMEAGATAQLPEKHLHLVCKKSTYWHYFLDWTRITPKDHILMLPFI
ncbi:unnamed protein product [marine sediment metagenome]|uniref:Uncharacterized protein n=1 Tax=marine sediment metagenome TaxID=412755 RepID=X1BUG7_9ZZZZ